MEAVKQQAQLSENIFLLSTLVKMIPAKYQQDLIRLRAAKEGTEGNTLWTILQEFMAAKRKEIERFSPWEIDDKTVKPPDDPKPGKTCDICKSKSHLKKDCPRKAVGRTAAGLNVKDQKKFDEKQTEYGPCPVCKENHSFRSKSGFDLVSCRQFDCPKFKDMAPADRATQIEMAKGCAACTSWKHARDTCNMTPRPCGVEENGVKCTLLHSRMLHGTRVKYVNVLQHLYTPPGLKKLPTWPKMNDYLTLLHMVKIKWSHGIVTTLFMDDGSTTSLITHRLAGFLGLVGVPTVQYMEVMGHDYEEINTLVYKLVLTDRDGKKHKLNLIGIDRIATNPRKLDVSVAYKLFPHIPAGALDRPGNDIGILIGQDQVHLLPTGGEGRDQVEGLRVMRTKFGSGFVLGGWNQQITGKLVVKTEAALRMTMAKFAKQFVNGKRINIMTSRPNAFMEAEEIGTVMPRRCDRCLGCARCSSPSQEHTRLEQFQLQLLRKALHHDEEKQRVTVSYPLIGDITKMRDNRYQVVGMALGLEKKLRKLNKMEIYNEVIREFIKRGVWVRIWPEELAAWKEENKSDPTKGVVHYISHHGVEKESSRTTPLRLVANCAIKNCSTGPSANDLWPKGPNSINNLLQVMLRWRMYVKAFVYDLHKAYQSVFTTLRERFLRLVVWRFGISDAEWETYGFDCMTFGDVSASVILELVKELAARKYAYIDESAALKVEEDSYVEDNLSGGSEEEVARMRGNCIKTEEGFEFDGTVPQILAGVGLKTKLIITSEETDKDLLKKFSGEVLGHGWDPVKDKLVYNLKVNLYGKKRGVKQGPDCTEEDADWIAQYIFTRRKVLSFLNAFYDVLGLLCALIIKYKIELRDILRHEELEWDTPLPEKWQKVWREIVMELVHAVAVTAPRGTKLRSCIGRPELVAYWDGSEDAYATLIYIRWLVSASETERVWHTCLLTAKARVTPVGGITTPRSELNGLVILGRLMEQVVDAMREKPARITMVGDSTCVISAYESHTASLAPYFSNRIVEVEDKVQTWGKQLQQEQLEDTPLEVIMAEEGETGVDLLFHTPGPLNPADLSTRKGVTVDQIQEGSEWQTGPAYLLEPRGSWPVSREFQREVPSTEKRCKFYEKINCLRVNALKVKLKTENRLYRIMEYSHNLLKVRGIMARTLRALSKLNKTSILDPLTVEDYNRADQLMRVMAMRETVEMMEKQDLSGLSPFWEGCVAYTHGRLGPSMKKLLGQDKLMILSPKSRLAELFMIRAHREDHRPDAGDTLYRSRKMEWIVRGRPLAEKTVKDCGFCTRERGKTLAQQMGDYPPEKFAIPCRPYTHVCVDLAGPYEVVAMNHARSNLKV